jgi:hypothetical protein
MLDIAAHERLVWVRYFSEVLLIDWLGRVAAWRQLDGSSYTCSGFASLQYAA